MGWIHLCRASTSTELSPEAELRKQDFLAPKFTRLGLEQGKESLTSPGPSSSSSPGNVSRVAALPSPPPEPGLAF